MKITKNEVLNVAKLARLDLDESSLDKFGKQVGQILEYVKALNRVDTKDVPPTSHAIDLTNAFREDRLKEHIDREKALSNAPEKDDGYFVVPKVVG